MQFSADNTGAVMAKDVNTGRTKKLPAYECIECGSISFFTGKCELCGLDINSQKNKESSLAAPAAEPTKKEEK
jgi:hypothetical protein